MVLRARSRSAEYAWLITGPLAVFAIVALAAFWANDPRWYEGWPLGLVLLAADLIAYIGVFLFTIRRSVFNVFLTDIPLLLAFYYLSPTMVILMVGVASMIVQLLRPDAVATKRWFNVTKSTASVTAALLVLAALPDVHGAGPIGWVALFAAIVVN